MSLPINFQVLDTLKWSKKDGFFLKDIHIERTWDAFQFFKVHLSLPKFELIEIYDQLEQQLSANYDLKVRIQFNKESSLSYKYDSEKIENLKTPIYLEVINALSLPVGEGTHSFKTTERQHWDLLLNLKSNKADDVVSLNTNGHIVEASRFNLFFYDLNQNICFTPSLNSGCLKGVFRQKCLLNKAITLPDLNKTIPIIEKDIPLLLGRKLSVYVGNSVRGLLPAVFV